MTNEQPLHRIDALAIKNLRAQLEGSAYIPGDEDYHEACLSWFKSYEQKPAIVIMPANTIDVRVAIKFAKEHSLPIGVQGGKGHGQPQAADGALLINFA